jgi:DNA repair protein RecO (recombination protein O)
MEILKTTGIALSSHESGEADIICNYFTRDFGKRRFVFKGLKKSKKRSHSATEPGALANLMYYYRKDRDSFIVNDVAMGRYHASIRNDLRKIFHLYFVLDAVDKTCGYEMADEAIFKLLEAGIDVLAKTEHPAHLSAFFILHLLKHHGILADAGACKMCGLERTGFFTLDILDLRPVCASCLKNGKNGPKHRSAMMSGSMRDYMRVSMQQRYRDIDTGIYREDDILDLLFSMSLFIENYFHTELKSKSFIFSDRFR